MGCGHEYCLSLALLRSLPAPGMPCNGLVPLLVHGPDQAVVGDDCPVVLRRVGVLSRIRLGVCVAKQEGEQAKGEATADRSVRVFVKQAREQLQFIKTVHKIFRSARTRHVLGVLSGNYSQERATRRTLSHRSVSDHLALLDSLFHGDLVEKRLCLLLHVTTRFHLSQNPPRTAYPWLFRIRPF